MLTSSAKSKGRRLQQAVRDDLLAIGMKHGLEAGDIESRGMGQAGVDLILSPAAKRLFSLAIECKNVEKLNIVGVFKGHYEKYQKDPALKLLIHSRNRTEPMVTLMWSDFLNLLEERVNDQRKDAKTERLGSSSS